MTLATARLGRVSLKGRGEGIRRRGFSVVLKTVTPQILVVLPVPTAPLVLAQMSPQVLQIQTVTAPAPLRVSARLGQLLPTLEH